MGSKHHRCRIGEQQCKSKAKSTGRRCRNGIVPGRAVCELHGGLGGRPPKHGMYSGAFVRLRKVYEAALADPRLMDLREPIALLKVQVDDSVRRVEENDTPAFRRRALSLMQEAKAATREGKVEDAQAKLIALEDLLGRGVAEDKALDRMAHAVDRLAKRVEGAWTIALAQQQAINVKDLVVILARFVACVVSASEVEAKRMAKRIEDGHAIEAEFQELPARVGVGVADEIDILLHSERGAKNIHKKPTPRKML